MQINFKVGLGLYEWFDYLSQIYFSKTGRLHTKKDGVGMGRFGGGVGVHPKGKGKKSER